MQKRIYATNFILLLFTIQVFSQTFSITGTVKDATTTQPVPFANVFIANTTIGTTTNEKGEFLISKVPLGTVIVSVSILGYEPTRQTVRAETETNKVIDFAINPSDEELTEVKIAIKRDKNWEKKAQRFTKLILGESIFAKNCIFKNLYDVDFEDISGKLNAKSKVPLEIENVALGYKIFFTLVKFTSSSQDINYQGYARFIELKPKDDKEKLQWLVNRKMAFEGSDRHFFWSLAKNKLKSEGYETYIDKLGINPDNRTVSFFTQLGKTILPIQLDTLVQAGKIKKEFKLKFPRRVEVHFDTPYLLGEFYKDDARMISWLENTNTLTFNEEGIVQNPNALVVSGFMSNKRLAEMLPIDYVPANRTEQLAAAATKTNLSSEEKQTLWRLQEGIHLVTNKNYYHPDENIWFAGKRLYADESMRDSISKLVYVELINPEGKIEIRQKLNADSLNFQSYFSLKNAEIGNYRIRAYTNWMRNYGDSCFFNQIIPIVLNNQFVSSLPKGEIQQNLSFETNKKVYKPREEIKIKIDGNLSKFTAVSVTDTNAIKSFEAIKIKTQFLRPDMFTTMPPFTNLAESGVSLSGTVLDKKGKPTQANILFYFGKSSPFTVPTDEFGSFYISGLQLYDSTKYSFQATDLKGKLLEEIKLNPESIPAVSKVEFPAIKVKETAQTVVFEKDFDIPKDAILLGEVSIKTKKRDEQVEIKPIYGKADYVLSGKDISPALAGTNPILALQGKVPGLRVVERLGTFSVSMRGGGNSLVGSTDPLYLIDGVPVEDVTILATMSMDMIDRIEVLKTARAMFGSRGANGVIALYTKNAVNRGYTTPSEDINVKKRTIVGFNKNKSFFSPNYIIENNLSKPDTRTSIFWNPILTENQISFFAADTPTVYRIEIVTEKGKVVSFVEVR